MAINFLEPYVPTVPKRLPGAVWNPASSWGKRPRSEDLKVLSVLDPPVYRLSGAERARF